MQTNLLNGNDLASQIKASLTQKVKQRQQQQLSTPSLHVILVGDDPASATYVRLKQQDCHDVGIHSHCHRLPASTSQQQLADLITQCNNDPSIHGILLQLPLPSKIDALALLDKIDPNKDVDGFHPYNLGCLSQRRPRLRPCTPKGVMTLLHSTKQSLTGKHAVIVGASNHVGRPMALELLLAKCTVTVCHRFTADLATHMRIADLLITAIGKPGIVKTEWIKPGTTIIDVGFTKLANGRFSGDVEFASAQKIAQWITPVPGGVGPMTRASLLENTLIAAELNDQLARN